MIFRHPVRVDEATGKQGKRVRRGLGTRDRLEAEALIEQLNVILGEPSYWDATTRSLAELRFDPRVVEAFYFGITAEEVDYWALRDDAIPLPTSHADGYRQVQLLGTTGAGKTTLVRQLIGTDPRTEKFPSTSTAKTTIADTEVVLTNGPTYRAIVTFYGSDEVREYVQETISAAVLAAYRGAGDAEVERRLLQHVDQRFRLNYVLGNGPALGRLEDADPLEDEDDDAEGEDGAQDLQPEDLGVIDLDQTTAILEDVLSRVRSLASRLGAEVKATIGAVDKKDERVVDELIEDQLDNLLREDEEFHQIADDLVEEVERRFALLDVGTVTRGKQGWPMSWSWETEARDAFVKAVQRFSSNYAPYFGRLLTPLVNGIRVAGPFAPSWSESQPKLVLMDGEGLGHTADSASSLPTALMRRLDRVDAVVLVDNAIQPMQAAPVAAMRALVSSGNAAKLLVCFTHVDTVKGDNLQTAAAKEEHVLASAENVLRSVADDLGLPAAAALRRRLETGCFYLGGLHLPIKRAGRQRTISQMQSLLVALEHVVDRAELVDSRPVYDKVNLVLAVRSASERFHAAWWGRLGLEERSGAPKQPWQRVKALSRRLAYMNQEGYVDLLPVADLERELREQIFLVVQNPREWTGAEPTDQERELIFGELARAVTQRVRALAANRLWDARLTDWQEAYNLRGKGSTFDRARLIAADVYNRAAPVPDATPSLDRNEFLHEIIRVVGEATAEVGAELT